MLLYQSSFYHHVLTKLIIRKKLRLYDTFCIAGDKFFTLAAKDDILEFLYLQLKRLYL